MTNEKAIEILKPLFEQCKGKNGCCGYIEHFFTKDEEKALDIAVKALERDGTIMFEDDEPTVCMCPVCGSVWKKVETYKRGT